MNGGDWALVAWLLVLSIWIAIPTKRRVRQAGETFARKNLAYVDSEFVPAFDGATRWNFAVLGATNAIVYGVGVGWLQRPSAEAGPGVVFAVIPLSCVALLITLGVQLRLAGREFPVPRGRSVTARVRRVEVADYVPRRAMAASRWATLVTGLLGVAAAVAGASGDIARQQAVLVASSAAALAVLSVLLRWSAQVVCERPQSAVDACHLYFQDAWRAQSLWGIHLAIAGAPVLLAVCLSTFLPDPFRLCVPLLGMLVGAAVLIRVFAGCRLWFRERLWPTLAPGQVLYPGQPVPQREEITA